MVSNTLLKQVNDIHKIVAKTFYDYIFENDDYYENYEKLVKGLSVEQKQFIHLTISRALYLYSAQYEILTDFTVDELMEQMRFNSEITSKIIYNSAEDYYQYDKYKLPLNFFESTIFLYKMDFDKIKHPEKVNGKDIIDAGAFCGDSALILNEMFKPARIFCFEPEDSCYNSLLRTIQLNEPDTANFTPIKRGLWNKIENREMVSSGAASSIMLAETIENLQNKSQIPITTIDNFAEEHNLDVGLIKIDVEGFDYEVLQGAENTIRKFKPVIMGSIYHNAQQFFEFKPLLESWDLGYKFHFDKKNPNKFLNEIIVTCEVY